MSIRSCSGTRYIVCGYRSTLPDIERQDMRTCCERVLFMHHPWMCTRPEIPERPGPAPVPVVSRFPQRQAGPCAPSAGHRAKRVRARWRRPVPGCSPASPPPGSATASPWRATAVFRFVTTENCTRFGLAISGARARPWRHGGANDENTRSPPPDMPGRRQDRRDRVEAGCPADPDVMPAAQLSRQHRATMCRQVSLVRHPGTRVATC